MLPDGIEACVIVGAGPPGSVGLPGRVLPSANFGVIGGRETAVWSMSWSSPADPGAAPLIGLPHDGQNLAAAGASKEQEGHLGMVGSGAGWARDGCVQM